MPQVEPGTEQWVFNYKSTSKGTWELRLGAKLFDMMMNSYDKSMDRKRRQDPIGSLNFLGDQT